MLKAKKIIAKSPERFAFIMRGVPGSGKSTTAIKLAGSSGIIHAVDNYHVDSRGSFCWDDAKVEEYYERNFRAFTKSCQRGYPVIVCDCINIERADFKKYIDVAKQYGYITSTVVMDPPAPLVAAQRNVHSVTVDQINDMYKKWEH